MSRTTIAIAGAIALVVTLPAVSAHAQAPRTFVSAVGSDSNPCSFAAPCRHFQAAVNATSAGGEVDALDPAGYGPIIITQAVTIEGQGWSYIAPPANGNGITINAVSGNVAVHGVSINGVGITGAINGIVFNSGDTLEVTNCIARNFAGSGIAFLPSSSATFKVTNSEFDDNANQGIVIAPSGTVQITGVIDHVGLYNDFIGLNLLSSGTTGGTVSVTVHDSIASNNNNNNTNSPPTNGAGFAAQATVSQAVTHLMLVKSVAAYNFDGVIASGANAEVFVNDSTITKNTNGWLHPSSGVIVTYGNNAVDDNMNGETAQIPASLK